jgi:hypothetical protein
MKLLSRNSGMHLLLFLTLSLFLFLIQGLWKDGIRPFLSVEAWRYIISGTFLQGPFDIRHAGTCFDQPTIGKYLFWFSLTAFSSSASLVLLRQRLASSSFWQQGLFILFATISTLLALTLLVTPTCLFLHYVTAMGMTTKRVLGLLLCSGLWLVLPCFTWAVCRKEWRHSWLFVVTAWGALVLPLLFPSYLIFGGLLSNIWNGRIRDSFNILELIFLGLSLIPCILATYLCRYIYREKVSEVIGGGRKD